MTKDFFKSFKFLVLILSILGISSCSKKDEFSGPGGPCGVGSGDYYDSVVTYPPENFNCNSTTNFSMEVKPHIDLSYNGGSGVFNRYFFELKKDNKVYRSNYVEFFTENDAIQQLEWGGSLPTGTYTVKGYLRNIQLYFSCEDNIYVSNESNLGSINITEFSNPEKVMSIEYFCQDSDTNIIDRYDVFLSPNTLEYMNIAFNIANTRYNITTYNTNLTTYLIKYDIFDFSEIIDYIYTFKIERDSMFLCGIKGFKDYMGYYDNTITGVSWYDEYDPTPTCSTGSLVAIKACIDLVAYEYNIDYNDFVTATTIHELGHQRASLDDNNHFSVFCIMNLGLVDLYERNKYSNPHFCQDCINKLKTID